MKKPQKKFVYFDQMEDMSLTAQPNCDNILASDTAASAPHGETIKEYLKKRCTA